MRRPSFEEITDVYERYGEPCNNCIHFEEGILCGLDHRQKEVDVNTGHIPELTVRKIKGCSDHQLKDGVWWNEVPLISSSSVYGGSKTSII